MAVTTHKVIKITQLGTPQRGAKLTLQFRASPDQIYVERLEGYIGDGYKRTLPVGSDNWQLISVAATGPVVFEVEDV